MAQTVTDWEWCIVDDCSARPETQAALAELATRDPRIHVAHRSANGGIVAASNDALAMATGEFVVFLDHDDLLDPSALAEMAATLASSDEIDYVYSDETHIDPDGKDIARFLKPDWSPERFRASMYTCHLSVLRRRVVTEVGGFRAGYDGSQDHDLILRATEAIEQRGRRIVHLPKVLYYWRHVPTSVSRASSSLTNAVARGRQAVQDQCDRLGLAATVQHGPLEGTYRLVRSVPEATTVTVVVATKGERDHARPDRPAAPVTLAELSTTHPRTKLVVAHPGALSTAHMAELRGAAGERWEFVAVQGEWSLAAALDQAFGAYPGDVLVSVAPGLVPRTDLTPDWLETLVGLARSPGVGVAGAMIVNTDGIIIHSGWDVPNFRRYELVGLPVGAPSIGNDVLIERECSEVSLAAAAVTAGHWREARSRAGGGFDDAGRGLSAALAETGARNVWTPYARLDHVAPIRLSRSTSRYRPARVARGLLRRARALTR